MSRAAAWLIAGAGALQGVEGVHQPGFLAVPLDAGDDDAGDGMAAAVEDRAADVGQADEVAALMQLEAAAADAVQRRPQLLLGHPAPGLRQALAGSGAAAPPAAGRRRSPRPEVASTAGRLKPRLRVKLMSGSPETEASTTVRPR